jgi:hypothetical protein
VDSEDERMNSNENEETQEEEATSNMVCFWQNLQTCIACIYYLHDDKN